MEQVHHWIDGHVVEGASGRVGPVYDPAAGVQAAEVSLASVAEVDAAVAAASAAFPVWRATSLARRSEIMFAFRELMQRHRSDLAAIVSREHGKVPADAMGEVARGLENVEFACG